MDYSSTTGCVLRRGDRNDVTVTFELEPAAGVDNVQVKGMRGYLCKSGSGFLRIKRVKDHLGATILTYAYRPADSALVSVTDYTGRVVTYTYSDTQLVGVTDVLGRVWTFSYTDAGDLRVLGRPDGYTLTLALDGMGRLTEARTSEGFWDTFKYESLSGGVNYVRGTNGGGRVTERWIDARGRESRYDINGTTYRLRKWISDDEEVVTDFSGQKTTVRYDTKGRVVYLKYPDLSEETFSYHPIFGDLLVQHRWPNGSVTVYRHDAHGNALQAVEGLLSPDQRVTLMEYDVYGNPAKITLPGTLPIRLEYDNKGNQTRAVDPAGNAQLLAYDVLGLTTSFRDARGKQWTFEQDPAGHRTLATDPEGRTVAFLRDFLGNIVAQTDAGNHTTTFEYSKEGPTVTKVVDGSDVQTFSYNLFNLLSRQTDSDGFSIAYDYDAPGRVKQIGYATGETVKLFYAKGSEAGGVDFATPVRIEWPGVSQIGTYDRRGNLANTIWTGGDGGTARLGHEFDPMGDVTAITDGTGKTFRLEYDVHRRTRARIDPAGVRATVSYDAMENPVAFEDSRGAVTRFEYDSMKRKSKETKPLLQATYFSYDENGNLTQSKDAKGQVLRHYYSDVGRRVRTEMRPTEIAAPTTTVDYEYDARGHLVRWTDGTFTGTYSYDGAGRMTGQSLNYGSFTKDSQYTFTSAGRIRTRRGPDGAEVRFLFDGAGRESAISIPGVGDVTNTGFTGFFARSTLYPGGLTRELSINGLGLAASIAVKDVAGKGLLDHQYVRGPDLRLQSYKLESTETGFAYDVRGRVQSYTENGTTHSLEYDEQGNLVQRDDTFLVYNLNNEIVSSGSVTYTHDANGNLIYRSGPEAQRYYYDIANRLVKVEDGAGATLAEFGYDPFDRRLWKKSGGHTTYYYYEAEGLDSEMDESGNVLASYGYWPGSRFGTNPVYLRRGDSYYFYQNDYLGAPRLLVDISGGVVWKASYGLLGRTTVSVQTVVSNLRLPGQYFDAETNLHYNWRRYYDPDLGRYLTPDPNGLVTGLNLYTYTDGDPVNESDPHGECWWGVVTGAVTGAAVSLVSQIFLNPCKDINWWQVGREAAIGAGIGLVTCGLGRLYQGVSAIRAARAARTASSGLTGGTEAATAAARTAQAANPQALAEAARAARAANGLQPVTEAERAIILRSLERQEALRQGYLRDVVDANKLYEALKATGKKIPPRCASIEDALMTGTQNIRLPKNPGNLPNAW